MSSSRGRRVVNPYTATVRTCGMIFHGEQVYWPAGYGGVITEIGGTGVFTGARGRWCGGLVRNNYEVDMLV